MSQATPTIGANKPGLTYRNEDNAGKQALLSSHKGSTAPSYAVAGTIWLDDSAALWLLKIYDGSDWITFGAVNATTNAFTPFLGTSAIKYLNYAADTGAANAYAVAPTPAISTYTAGQLVTLRPSANNTGASTLAVSGLSAVNIKLLNGGNPHAGALLTSGIYHLVYDGTNFVLLNPSYAFGSAAFVDLIDEDDMASDSPTRPPSQQSVAAFVRAAGGTGRLLNTIYYTCPSQTCTISVASPAVITYPNTGRNRPQNGCPVRLTTTGTLPTGLSTGVTYYVVNSSGSTSNLALTPGGTPIATTGAGSGTHTIQNAPYEKGTNNPSFIEVTVVGTGGNTNTNVGGAGGGGAKKKILNADLSTSETVTTGAISGVNTGSGGTSSFGSHCSATGGSGNSTTATTAGGEGTGGDLNLRGVGGSNGQSSSNGGGGMGAFGMGAGSQGGASFGGQMGVVIVEEYA